MLITDKLLVRYDTYNLATKEDECVYYLNPEILVLPGAIDEHCSQLHSENSSACLAIIHKTQQATVTSIIFNCN